VTGTKRGLQARNEKPSDCKEEKQPCPSNRGVRNQPPFYPSSPRIPSNPRWASLFCLFPAFQALESPPVPCRPGESGSKSGSDPAPTKRCSLSLFVAGPAPVLGGANPQSSRHRGLLSLISSSWQAKILDVSDERMRPGGNTHSWSAASPRHLRRWLSNQNDATAPCIEAGGPASAAIRQRAPQVRTVQPGPAQVCPEQLRAAKVRAVQIRHDKAGSGEVGAPQDRPVHGGQC
jgi:hypothetical protein